MGNFNITRANASEKINELLEIFSNDEQTKTNWTDCIKKLKCAIDSYNDNEIKIALMGSFSDGKTSTIAGMMGELMDDMKIDTDESSDELARYRPKGLKKGFVIIDTPGLFGTKEKKVDGKNIKFSKQTEDFISEADIILYVTDASVPIIEDHKEIMKKVLRTYNKLDKTLFVLNKMDAIVDPRDDEAYKNKSNIKTAALVDRLKDIIDLSENEISTIKSVCICADPKGKGIAYWLKNPKYNKLSRIPELWKEVNLITNSANSKDLKADSLIASIREVLEQFVYDYNCSIKPLLKAQTQLKEDIDLMEMELKKTREKIKNNKILLRNEIKAKQNCIISDIDNADLESFGSLIEREIGVEEGKVSFYILIQDINGILETYAEKNASSLEASRLNLKTNFENQDDVILNAVNKVTPHILNSAKGLKATHILKARDLFVKGYKFNPWGATKLAGSIGKAAGWVGVALQGVEILTRVIRNKKLEKAKKEIKESINKYFAQIFELFNDDETYLKNFAPSFIDMQNEVEDRKKVINQIIEQTNALELFKAKLDRWYGYDIEDVAFEEV